MKVNDIIEVYFYIVCIIYCILYYFYDYISYIIYINKIYI